MGFNYGPLVTISSEKLNIILPQSHKCFCKIINNKINQAGYLCKIPFPDSNNLKFVLIVNNYLFKEFIEKEKIIQFENFDHYLYKINIDESRFIYNNRQFNITIIEIKEDDGLDINSFLEIDDQIFKENLKEIYKEQSDIYTIKLSSNELIQISKGIILKIIDDKFDSNIDLLMGDGLLFNYSNYKVIGVKLAVSNKLIKGAFLKIPIIEYFKLYNQNQRFKNDGNKSNSLIKNDNKYIEELIKKNTYLINELNKLENEFNKASSENRLLKRKLTDLESIIKEKDVQLNKSLSKIKDLEKILKNKSKANFNLEKILSLMKELEEIKS